MASEAPPLLFAANKSFFVQQQQKQTKQQHKNPKNQKQNKNIMDVGYWTTERL